MDDLPSAPEGNNSEVEKEISSPPTAPEQQEVSVPTRHDDDEARKIEEAFTKTEERTDDVRQEARDEGAKLARETQETSKPQQQHIQEVPKPIAPIENHTEGLGPQTQPEQQPEHPQTQPQMHPLTNFALVSSEQRAVLREKLQAENGKVKKAA